MVDWTSNYWWVGTIVFGTVVLGVVMAYALLTRRTFSRSEKLAQDEAVNALYNDSKGRSSPAGKARQAETRQATGGAPVPPVKNGGS
jgi:hypothetical protein